MVRPAANDLLQSFRFHVTAAEIPTVGDPLQYTERGTGFEQGGQAGFQSVTLPDVTLEATEYREGTMKWTQKYPGPPTVSDVTLMRGVAKRDTAFHDWVMAANNGTEYRTDVTIWHYQRTEYDNATLSETDDSYRRVECKECFGMRSKPGADFDSMSGEVSLMECDFACESFEVEYEAA